MNDSEYEALKARIDAIAKRWRRPMGLGFWDVQYAFVRDGFESDGKPAPDAAATCKADWRYLRATLSFNMLRLSSMDDGEIEQVIVHEFMHIFLNETRALRPDDQLTAERDDWLAHEERMASQLANAFIWVREIAEGKRDER